jgi:hypothetical protein
MFLIFTERFPEFSGKTSRSFGFVTPARGPSWSATRSIVCSTPSRMTPLLDHAKL